MNVPYICINSHGAYTVAIPYPHETKLESGKNCATESFFPSVYGDEDKALMAAKEWRDEKGIEIYGNHFHDMLQFGRRMPKRKVRAGSKNVIEPGLRFEPDRGKEGAYCASWVHWVSPTEKKDKSKSFSVAKYGKENALALAKKAREDGVREGLKSSGAARHTKSKKGLGSIYYDSIVGAWVAQYKLGELQFEKYFFNSVYPDTLESKPNSWWSFQDALEFRREIDVREKGKSYLPATTKKMDLFYRQKMKEK